MIYVPLFYGEQVLVSTGNMMCYAYGNRVMSLSILERKHQIIIVTHCYSSASLQNTIYQFSKMQLYCPIILNTVE